MIDGSFYYLFVALTLGGSKNMLTGIKYVVVTNSEEERQELREVIFSKKLAASVMTNTSEKQYIAICTGDVWFLTTIGEERASTNHYQIFDSVAEFIQFFNKNNL